MKKTNNTTLFGTFSVYAATEEEYKSLSKYFASRGTLFSSSVGGENSLGKSAEEIAEEAEYAKLSGLKRFRMTREEKEKVDAGETTRAKLVHQHVIALRRKAKSENKAVETE